MENFLKKNYNLNLQNYKPHLVGFNNKCYILKSKNQEVFYKVYQRIPIDQIEKILDVLIFLSEKDIPTPKPIKSINRKYITNFKKEPGILFGYLNGKVKKDFSNKELFEVGNNLANLHLLLNEYPLKKQFIKKGTDYNSTEWYDNNLKILKELKSSEAKLIIKEYNKLKKQIPKAIDLNKLPLSLLHWDFRNENILFKKNKITGITDFENICYDNRIYDLIFAIIGFCMLKGSLKKEEVKSLIDGYALLLPLKEKEYKALPYLLKLMIWDKWCSIYVTAKKGITHRRKSRTKYIYYKKCYFKIKDDSIL